MRNYVPSAIFATNHTMQPVYSEIWNDHEYDLKLLCIALCNVTQEFAYAIFTGLLHFQFDVKHFEAPEFPLDEFSMRYRCFSNIIDFRLGRAKLNFWASLLLSEFDVASDMLLTLLRTIITDERHLLFMPNSDLIWLPVWWFKKVHDIFDEKNWQVLYFICEDFFEDLQFQQNRLELAAEHQIQALAAGVSKNYHGGEPLARYRYYPQSIQPESLTELDIDLRENFVSVSEHRDMPPMGCVLETRDMPLYPTEPHRRFTIAYCVSDEARDTTERDNSPTTTSSRGSGIVCSHTGTPGTDGLSIIGGGRIRKYGRCHCDNRGRRYSDPTH